MDNCPKCNSSWLGEPIPVEYQGVGGRTHYGREIGIDGGYIGVYDGVVAIKCPDCGAEFPRSNHPIALELFEKYNKVMYGG